jgi:hypothetical protein
LISFGFHPLPINVTLSTDGDFVTSLVASQDWAAGTTIELRFPLTSPIVWAATIAGLTASWDVPASTVAAAITAGVRDVRLHYRDGAGDDILWGKGRVTVV